MAMAPGIDGESSPEIVRGVVGVHEEKWENQEIWNGKILEKVDNIGTKQNKILGAIAAAVAAIPVILTAIDKLTPP